MNKMFSLLESVCSAGSVSDGDVPAARGYPCVPKDKIFSFLLLGKLEDLLCWNTRFGGSSAERRMGLLCASWKLCARVVGHLYAADIAVISLSCNYSVSRCFHGTVLLFWKSSHSLLVI